MQEFVLVISRCVSKKKTANRICYCFHFKGYFAGQRIKCIHLFSGSDIQLSKGDDYLLWVKCQEVNQEILRANLIKFKKII